jgi:hypothetical protein
MLLREELLRQLQEAVIEEPSQHLWSCVQHVQFVQNVQLQSKAVLAVDEPRRCRGGPAMDVGAAA